jgi:hypothetical protein
MWISALLRTGAPVCRSTVNLTLCAGKFIAAGTLDGRVCVYDVETSQWDHRVCEGVRPASAIAALLWTRMHQQPHVLPELLRAASSLRPTLLSLPPEGTPFSYPPLEDTSTLSLADADPTLRDAKEVIQLMCASDVDGGIGLTMGVSLPLGSMPRVCSLPANSVALAADWSLLACVFSGTPSLVLYDTTALSRSAASLHEVCSWAVCFCHGAVDSGFTRFVVLSSFAVQISVESASVSACLQHCSRAVSIMAEAWDATSKATSSRWSDLARLIRDYGERELSAMDELAAVFASGTHSSATLQFFQTVFNEAAVLKTYRAVETTCSLLESLVRF